MNLGRVALTGDIKVYTLSYLRRRKADIKVYLYLGGIALTLYGYSVSQLILTYWRAEVSLFVLASPQKIPVLRTENPAVDTRTICLLPIEFF